MATYIILMNFTAQGLSTVKDTVKRAKAATNAWAQAGTSLREIVWTQGKYDLVAIAEAPDDATATAMVLNIAKQGNVHTQMLRGFTATEMEKILEKVA